MLGDRNLLGEFLAAGRTRTSWNDRLTHWERPASDSEEAKIQRAATDARAIVSGNATLIAEGVQIAPQGSYFNNTNVRLEADMDLRLQLPGLLVKYADGINADYAYRAGGYTSTGRNVTDIANLVRQSLAADCRARFGNNRVSIGNKAVTVDGLTGSSANVDLVPAFRLHLIRHNGRGGYETLEGTVIVGTDGSHTVNFPDQHHANGMAKRARTQHRFKKLVRMLKRLNYELEEQRLIPRRLPSFLVECLVYFVGDMHFLVEEDRYDRLRRICTCIHSTLYDEQIAASLCEVNDIKFLFRPSQAWTLHEARLFINAARARLEA